MVEETRQRRLVPVEALPNTKVLDGVETGARTKQATYINPRNNRNMGGIFFVFCVNVEVTYHGITTTTKHTYI